MDQMVNHSMQLFPELSGANEACQKCKKKRTISVIMLTFNREQLVGRAIEGILGQTFRDFEFIIVDNGSSDQSGTIADTYARKDDRIQVIHREKGSIGSGRNTGLGVASGEYIAFVDDDDICETDYLEFLYRLAETNQADMAICSVEGKFYDKIEIFDAEGAMLELLQRKKYNVGFPTKLIRRTLFEMNCFPETGRYDDIYLMPHILACVNKVVYHGLPKYRVYRHAQNNSAWTTNYTLLTPDILQEYLAVYDKRTKWLCERFPTHQIAWQYFRWSFMISMVEKITRLDRADCAELREQMVLELHEHSDAINRCAYTTNEERNWLIQCVHKVRNRNSI